MWKRVIAVVVVAAALAGALVYSQWRRGPLKVSGFIEADEIRVGSRVGGRVLKVAVEEGSVVKAGDTLVELEAFNLYELKAQAAAQLGVRKAEHDKLQAGFRPEEIAQAKARRDELEAKLNELVAGPRKETKDAAKARLESAQAELEYAKSSLAKTKAQFERGAASQDELEKATQALSTAKALEQMRRAELAELEAGSRQEDIAVAKAQLQQTEEAWMLQRNGSRKEDIDSAKAAMDSARAALDAIERQIEELKITAPKDGIVEACDLKRGDLVAPNAPALSMLDPGRIWVRAFVPEDFPNLKPGQKVLVSVDGFPGRKFKGHVSFVARQAEFTPNNVQTPEKRSEQVFRIKVILDEGLDVLRPGMPADVWLE